jgi:hypothetical protein
LAGENLFYARRRSGLDSLRPKFASTLMLLGFPPLLPSLYCRFCLSCHCASNSWATTSSSIELVGHAGNEPSFLLLAGSNRLFKNSSVNLSFAGHRGATYLIMRMHSRSLSASAGSLRSRASLMRIWRSLAKYPRSYSFVSHLHRASRARKPHSPALFVHQKRAHI